MQTESKLISTLQIATDDGTFTLIFPYDARKSTPMHPMSLKIQEDALSDNVFIDNDRWINDTFFPGIRKYHSSGFMPLSLKEGFSPDVLINITRNLGQLFDMSLAANNIQIIHEEGYKG